VLQADFCYGLRFLLIDIVFTFEYSEIERNRMQWEMSKRMRYRDGWAGELRRIVRHMEIGKTFYMIKSNRGGVLTSEWYRSKSDALAANQNNVRPNDPIAKHFRKSEKIAKIEAEISKRERKV